MRFEGFRCHPTEDALEDIRGQIELVRNWRNRIAHHRTVFDKSPNDKLQQILKLIGWVCRDTEVWVRSEQRVNGIIDMRPG